MVTRVLLVTEEIKSFIRLPFFSEYLNWESLILFACSFVDFFFSGGFYYFVFLLKNVLLLLLILISIIYFLLYTYICILFEIDN